MKDLKKEFEKETGEEATYELSGACQIYADEYVEWLESKIQQPQPEAQYQAKWILDDIEFGYDLESIKNKIKNNCYLNTGDTEILQPEVSGEKPFLCPHCNLIIHK